MPVDRTPLFRALVDRFLALMPPTPFGRLVRAHLVTMCADACVAASLAGSLFFQKPSSGARGSVLLYLVLTMAPFTVVAPVIGPALDRVRGGRRLLVVASCVGRAAICLIMASVVTKPSPEGLLVYPFAFGVLVLSKGYSVARSSLVPDLVDERTSLVQANSRLAIISAVAALLGGAPALVVQQLFGADWSLRLAVVVFIVAASFALRIPRVERVTGREAAAREREELHQPSILLAASAMAILRGAMGFLQFFAAFTFKHDLFALGVAAGAAGIGLFAGNLLAPWLRSHVREELILAGALLGAAAATLFGVMLMKTLGIPFAFLAVGLGAAAGKIGFDSLLQRDGPDAVRGRAFARFETRFQGAWVVGAVLGIIPVVAPAGLAVLGIVLAFGGVSYLAALRAARTRPPRSKLRPEAVDRALGRARDNLRDRRRQSRAGRRKAAARRRRQLAGGAAEPRRPEPADDVLPYPPPAPVTEPAPPPPPRRAPRP
jgi:MFS family permease